MESKITSDIHVKNKAINFVCTDVAAIQSKLNNNTATCQSMINENKVDGDNIKSLSTELDKCNIKSRKAAVGSVGRDNNKMLRCEELQLPELEYILLPVSPV